MLQRHDGASLETTGLAETNPGLDTAVLTGTTIVIEYPLDPVPAYLSVRAVGHQGRVFLANIDLIVEAIRYPTLNLLAGQFARVHLDLVGVMDVVARAEPA